MAIDIEKIALEKYPVREKFNKKATGTYDPNLPRRRAFIEGMKYILDNIWKKGDSDYLPEIDREVIALAAIREHPVQDAGYKVVFAHRPNPQGWTGTDITTGKKTHYTPLIYNKGGWNMPDVLYWLDVDVPKIENNEEEEE